MNNNLFSRITQERLVRYLDGTLDERETAEIDALLDSDPELQLLVDDYVNMQMEINNNAIAEKRNRTRTRSLRPLWISVAACVVVAAVSLTFLFVPSGVGGAGQTPVVRGDDSVFDSHSDTVQPLPSDTLVTE